LKLAFSGLFIQNLIAVVFWLFKGLYKKKTEPVEFSR